MAITVSGTLPKITASRRWPADGSLTISVDYEDGAPVGCASWKWYLRVSLNKRGSTPLMSTEADSSVLTADTLELTFQATAIETAAFIKASIYVATLVSRPTSSTDYAERPIGQVEVELGAGEAT